jgi:nickel-dependent lactate racemase
MNTLDLLVGRSIWTVDLGTSTPLVAQRGIEPLPLANVSEAVAKSLEYPIRFEAMRRALTPDDRITLVMDDRLPQLSSLLVPILDHLQSARISMENVTILTPDSGMEQDWINDLPDAFQDVRTEIHDPTNRQRLAYLASTKEGRRLYLNRTLVESDQIILLTGRRYDAMLGYSGAESLIFPTFAEVEVTASIPGTKSYDNLGWDSAPLRKEATEVAWLVGTPFLVQVIEGFGDTISSVVSGLLGTSSDGINELNRRWHLEFSEPADMVIATISGNSSRRDSSDIAQALFSASRVVRPGGKIVLLSEVEIQLDEGLELIRKCESPEEAFDQLRQQNPSGRKEAYQWTTAADHAHLYIAADIHPEIIEELFATPIQKAGEVNRLLESSQKVAIIPDAHKSLANLLK